ncbi:hypothetical protein DL771_007991 [Monosporascus sp. 5C6A]|nr:hypothetical protein DL771_007991 [Monosporascus sp. 5C6A]
MAFMWKRAAITRSSESAFRFKSEVEGVRFMNHANHPYANPFSGSDGVLSDRGGFLGPGLTDFVPQEQAEAKQSREEYDATEHSLPVKGVKREGGSLYSIPRQAGQRDTVNRGPKDEGRVTEGPAPVEDRDALKHRDEETVTPVKGIKRGRNDDVNLYDIPERPTPAKKPRNDDVSDLKAVSQYPAQEASSAGVRKQQDETANAGAGVPAEYAYLSAGDPDAARTHGEQARRGAAMLRVDFGRYAPRPQRAIWQHMHNLAEAVQQYEDLCAEGYDDPEHLEMIFDYLDSIKSWQEKTSVATVMQ